MDFHSTRPLVLLVAFGSGLAFSEACKSTKLNSNHCSVLEGDDTCAERYPGELVHCGGDCVDSENNDGCVADAPTDLDCWYPCGGDQTADDDMSCLGTTMTDTIATTMDSTGSDPSGDPTTADTSATTMGSMTQGSESDATDTTEGGGDCQTSADCTNAAFPVCLDHDCVACTDTPDGDMACAAKDEMLPVCNDAGECVQCNDGNAAACTGTTPVCDTGTSSCVGCTYHEQCSETACDIATGACFDDACVIEIDSGDSISDAIADGCVLIVHAGAYSQSVEIGAGITVAILAADGESPIVGGELGNNLPSLDITGDAVVYVQGLLLNGNDSLGVGIAVDAGTLYVDRAEVVGNSGGGVVLSNGADARVRNAIISGNGSGAGTTPGLLVENSNLQLLYTTVARNDADVDDTLVCSGGEAFVRNSILVGRDSPSIACPNLTVSYSTLDEDLGGDANEVVDAIVNGWFVNVPANNFELSATGGTQFADVAHWRTLDLAADPPRPANDPASAIDGQARPSVDDTPDYAGADIPD